MAIKHRYTLLCDYAFQDPDGKHGFLGAFSNIVLPQAPGRIPQFYLAVSVLGDAGEDVEVKLVNKARTWESLVVRFPLPAVKDPSGSSSGAIIMGRVNDQEFPAKGAYEVLVCSEGREIHSYDFGVVVQGGEKGHAP